MRDPPHRDRWGAVATRLRGTNPYGVDVLLAGAVAVPVSIPFLGGTDDVTLLGALLNAGTVVPLIWRRRSPATVGLIVAAFAFAVSAYGQPGQMLQYGGLLAMYTVADLARPWQRRAFQLGIPVILLPGALWKGNSAVEIVFTLLLPLTAYLLGALARTSRARTEALQERADQLGREREAEAARAAAEERSRIARDMHDVLAHAVTVMMVQAEAGPVVIRNHPEQAARVFDAIAEAGRDAMVQLQRALEVAAYRIVQEALTNTVRHADAGSVTVRLGWSADELVATVTDDGRGPDRRNSTIARRAGHGGCRGARAGDDAGRRGGRERGAGGSHRTTGGARPAGGRGSGRSAGRGPGRARHLARHQRGGRARAAPAGAGQRAVPGRQRDQDLRGGGGVAARRRGPAAVGRHRRAVAAGDGSGGGSHHLASIARPHQRPLQLHRRPTAAGPGGIPGDPAPHVAPAGAARACHQPSAVRAGDTVEALQHR